MPPPRLAAVRVRAASTSTPHGAGRNGEKVGAILPIHAARVDQLQIGLVHEGSRTELAFGFLAADVPPGHSAQMVVQQALFALRAARVPASDPCYRQGIAFLLRTQLEDGTWFVRSRAFGFQPYFETGFPYGRSQFISTAATAWAALAIAHSLD